jgi:hypothetical protein
MTLESFLRMLALKSSSAQATAVECAPTSRRRDSTPKRRVGTRLRSLRRHLHNPIESVT